jgi:hypothetical protein
MPSSSWYSVGGLDCRRLRRERADERNKCFHAHTGWANERVIARHWATAQKMKLVRDTPHVTLRGTEENNNVYFVEIFTWRDARVPDAAPAEIRNIWNEMNRLVEARGGHPGLDLVPVSLLSR